MAKLSAGRQKELFRYVKEKGSAQYVFMDSGKILVGGGGRYKLSKISGRQAEAEQKLIAAGYVKKESSK